MAGLTITAENDAYYIYVGKVNDEPGCVKKTVVARDDKEWNVNLDYDKDNVLIGIEILQHYHDKYSKAKSSVHAVEGDEK